MKEIKAFVRRSKMDDVVHGLKAIGVKAMSITSVEGLGTLSDPEAVKLSLNYISGFSFLYKIEIVCLDGEENHIVLELQRLAYTGEKGDGIIFISSIEHAIKIRTGKEGRMALDKISRNQEL